MGGWMRCEGEDRADFVDASVWLVCVADITVVNSGLCVAAECGTWSQRQLCTAKERSMRGSRAEVCVLETVCTMFVEVIQLVGVWFMQGFNLCCCWCDFYEDVCVT
ncbi:hypothetical protein GOODEAATRI_015147 [Goodea atripinnis]|uniref:Uncharacterized protein n=1 Tax=Goodea atripinnis TaxID=208336 RepID=A0ABV0PE85_9TELE